MSTNRFFRRHYGSFPQFVLSVMLLAGCLLISGNSSAQFWYEDPPPGYAGGTGVCAVIDPAVACGPGASCVEDGNSYLCDCGCGPPYFSTPCSVICTDSDGDSIGDDDDNCPSDANSDQADLDLDGVGDVCDNCPNDGNTNQADLDLDGIGDVCDPDADGDDQAPPNDCDDLNPAIYTGQTEICSDGIDNDCDLLIDGNDPEADCDGDSVENDLDNCPNHPNPGQVDTDGDGVGDVCDDDDDNDGLVDAEDNCPLVVNDQADFDGDGVGDACDEDRDGDGVLNGDDLCASTDASDLDAGVPGSRLGRNRWADVDGDGVFDTSGKNPAGRAYVIADAAGCNCAQIVEACGYGEGHAKFGCSNDVMDWWTGLHDRAGEDPYQCKAD